MLLNGYAVDISDAGGSCTMTTLEDWATRLAEAVALEEAAVAP